MPLKILVDENLPLRLSSFLKEHGFNVVDVREVGLRGATDEEILTREKSEFFNPHGGSGFWLGDKLTRGSSRSNGGARLLRFFHRS